jgi:lipocalin
MLAGNDAVANPRTMFPQLVALSRDQNTAIVADPNDNNFLGAAWVFARSGATWAQQGPKFVGAGTPEGLQGYALALSGDGNTFIVGAPEDAGGSAWVFTRAAGAWSRQGERIGGKDELGCAVALSADGSTAVVGGRKSVSFFSRSGGAWTEQGSMPVDSNGPTGTPVALSDDGNTAIVGAVSDGMLTGSNIGAALIFVRNGGAWTQQGPKLVGSDAKPFDGLGTAVALSADGNTAMTGGPGSHAVWMFVRTGGAWAQQGPKLVGGFQGALSADGNMAVLAASDQDGGLLVLTRSGGVWQQHGARIAGWLGGVAPAGAKIVVINRRVFVPAN